MFGTLIVANTGTIDLAHAVVKSVTVGSWNGVIRTSVLGTLTAGVSKNTLVIYSKSLGTAGQHLPVHVILTYDGGTYSRTIVMLVP